jgi:nitroreductase
MDALEAILTRRSSRQFTKEPVDDKAIDQLLHAAVSAPSAGNEQPWHFLLINDRNIINQIAKVHPFAKMCQDASLVIVPCADPILEKHKGSWILDLAAATENILIAARALNLGAVWVGVYPREDRIVEMRKVLTLPDTIIPFNVIPIGYTTQPQIATDRYNKERIHHNKW